MSTGDGWIRAFAFLGTEEESASQPRDVPDAPNGLKRSVDRAGARFDA